MSSAPQYLLRLTFDGFGFPSSSLLTPWATPLCSPSLVYSHVITHPQHLSVITGNLVTASYSEHWSACGGRRWLHESSTSTFSARPSRAFRSTPRLSVGKLVDFVTQNLLRTSLDNGSNHGTLPCLQGDSPRQLRPCVGLLTSFYPQINPQPTFFYEISEVCGHRVRLGFTERHSNAISILTAQSKSNNSGGGGLS